MRLAVVLAVVVLMFASQWATMTIEATNARLREHLAAWERSRFP